MATKVPMPNTQVPMVNMPNGTIEYHWQLFLLGLSGGAVGGDTSAVSVGVSPFTYTAKASGTVVVSGGTIALGRSGTFTTFSTTGGAVPVRSGDSVRVTYAGPAPSMTFYPD